jgi:hypothetical protein
MLYSNRKACFAAAQLFTTGNPGEPNLFFLLVSAATPPKRAETLRAGAARNILDRRSRPLSKISFIVLFFASFADKKQHDKSDFAEANEWSNTKLDR